MKRLDWTGLRNTTLEWLEPDLLDTSDPANRPHWMDNWIAFVAPSSVARGFIQHYGVYEQGKIKKVMEKSMDLMKHLYSIGHRNGLIPVIPFKL